MTRKDWWLGILVVLIGLVIQTLVLIHVTGARNDAKAPHPVPTQAWNRFQK